jgi:pilus assembly protein CpaE
MAVNLAVVIRQLTNQPVLLIDLSIERGAISVHLNLAPRLTLADLPTDAGSIDYDSIQTLITHHSTGIDVLAAPPTPQTAELVTAGAVSAMLPLMRQLYKWVVLDTTGTFSELNLGVFDQSDLFVVLCAPDLTSLKVTQATLDVFDALSISGDKRVLALNQIFPTSFLQREDLERTMGERIAVVVPYGGSALLDAADHGVPLVIGHPDSPAANAIRSFAEQLANVKATVQVEQKRGGLGKWVQGMLGSLRR